MAESEMWEYRVETDLSEPVLAALGGDGWELAGVDPRDGRGFFRRPGPSFRDRVTLDQKARVYAARAREREAEA